MGLPIFPLGGEYYEEEEIAAAAQLQLQRQQEEHMNIHNRKAIEAHAATMESIFGEVINIAPEGGMSRQLVKDGFLIEPYPQYEQDADGNPIKRPGPTWPGFLITPGIHKAAMEDIHGPWWVGHHLDNDKWAEHATEDDVKKYDQKMIPLLIDVLMEAEAKGLTTQEDCMEDGKTDCIHLEYTMAGTVRVRQNDCPAAIGFEYAPGHSVRYDQGITVTLPSED